jgi:hypothetical protein
MERILLRVLIRRVCRISQNGDLNLNVHSGVKAVLRCTRTKFSVLSGFWTISKNINLLGMRCAVHDELTSRRIHALTRQHIATQKKLQNVYVACCRRSRWRHLWLKAWDLLGTLHQKSYSLLSFYKYFDPLRHFLPSFNCHNGPTLLSDFRSLLYLPINLTQRQSAPAWCTQSIITAMMPTISVSSTVWPNYRDLANIWFCCSLHRKIEQVSFWLAFEKL